MTKMDATPIYGKTLLKSSPELEGQLPWDLVCSIDWRFWPYQDCTNDDPRLSLTYSTTRSNLIPNAFLREHFELFIFLKL